VLDERSLVSVTAGPSRRGIYYGWVLVLTLAVTETTSFGVLYYAFTVFIDPMQEDLGWSRAALTGAFSLAQLVSGIAAIPVGRWLDRHGPRVLMTVGSCVAALLVLAWSRVVHLPAFYLIWAAVGIAGAAVLYEPAFVVVANWFVRRRSRALTVLTFIAGFASVIYIPLASWLVEAQGWRNALVTLALILALRTISPTRSSCVVARRTWALSPMATAHPMRADLSTQHSARSTRASGACRCGRRCAARCFGGSRRRSF
jgi:MFS family permease